MRLENVTLKKKNNIENSKCNFFFPKQTIMRPDNVTFCSELDPKVY
jgi:hypothetical protein